MDIIKIMEKRYSAKAFDSEKKIPEATLKKVEELLQLSASSLNLQPWFFSIAISQENKEKIAKATEGKYSFNKDKVLNASAVVVFSTREDLNQEYLQELLEKEKKDGRFNSVSDGNKGINLDDSNNFRKDISEEINKLRVMSINNLSKEDLKNWLDKQIYLNAGSFLLGVAALGLDAVPIEGFYSNVVDEELDFVSRKLKSVLLVPIGYHTEADFNAKLPKSRFLKEKIIERI